MISTKWLVAVDDTEYANWAFNYTLAMMKPEHDQLFLMHVADEPATLFIGYASSSLLDTLYKVADEKARKILVHYGHKAQEAGIKFKMMKGTNSNPGELICKAIENYDIDTCVIGRRGLGSFERFFSGSTSRYVMENAECDVIIVKRQFGPAEEHGSFDLKSQVIQAEEHERLRRIEEAEEAPEIEHDVTIDEIKEAEETERARRVREQPSLKDLKPGRLTHYQFHDDILKLGKEKDKQEAERTKDFGTKFLEEKSRQEHKDEKPSVVRGSKHVRSSSRGTQQDLNKSPVKPDINSIKTQQTDIRTPLKGQAHDPKTWIKQEPDLKSSSLLPDVKKQETKHQPGGFEDMLGFQGISPDKEERRTSTGEKHNPARLNLHPGAIPKEDVNVLDQNKRAQSTGDIKTKSKPSRT